MSSPALDEPTYPPLEGMPLVLMSIGVTLAVFMEVLDITIVNTSVPAVSGSLGVSINEGLLVISAYALGSAVVQPLTGWLTRRFGEVRVFLVSTMLFTAMSALCGFAGSLMGLVVFRFLQGLVSGPLLGLSQSLLLSNCPERLRGIALGVWSMTVLGAPVIGPILGGWISDNFSWRWIFFINVPLGLISIGTSWFALKDRESRVLKVPVDYVGLLFLAVGIACLQFMLDHGQQHDWFQSALIRNLAMGGVVAAVCFLLWERFERHQIIDFSLFKVRNYSLAVAMVFIGTVITCVVVILTPLWLQQVASYSATQAGLASAGYGIGGGLAALVLGSFLHRMPLRSSMALFSLFNGAVLVWIGGIPYTASFDQQFWPRAIFGVVNTLFYLLLFHVVASSVRPDQLTSGTSVSGFFRVFGISAGAAITVTVWTHRSDMHHFFLADRLNNQSLENLGASATQIAEFCMSCVSSGVLSGMVKIQSGGIAHSDVCWLGAFGFFIVAPLCLLFKEPEFTNEGNVAMSH